jgi:hypothetical protein
MSESLIKRSVAEQISGLAELAQAVDPNVNCSQFTNQIIFSNRTILAGPGLAEIAQITVPDNQGLIWTAIDVKVLFDTTDTTLVPVGTAVPDLRSTDDLNPYGPFAAGANVGQFELTDNGKFYFGQTGSPSCWDIGLMNNELLFPFTGPTKLILSANPNQPAGKNICLVTRINMFACGLAAAVALKEKKTIIQSG